MPRRYGRPRRVSLQPELGLKLFKRDRVPGLIHRVLGLGGVPGVFRGTESLDHRFRDDGGHALAVDGQMGDHTTASQLDRLLDGGTADREIMCGLAHTAYVRPYRYDIYGHLFAQDRAQILKAMNEAVSRLYVQEDAVEDEAA